MLFSTREEAGEKLATQLGSYRDAKNTIVVALPRGGVPVGFELAQALHLPLELFFVKKIPSPYNEEAGIGAVTENGLMQINQQAVSSLDISTDYIQRRASEKLQQMQEKRKLYGQPLVNFANKTILLTDDGIATGSSILLAAKALKQSGAKKVTIAIPVAPSDILPLLEEVSDEVYVYHPSNDLVAVGRFYRDFHQLEDQEVMTILQKSQNKI